jgi:hypothetical protein
MNKPKTNPQPPDLHYSSESFMPPRAPIVDFHKSDILQARALHAFVRIWGDTAGVDDGNRTPCHDPPH